MILPGTYANGFAPRDGEPLFPELWRGCVGAWNPGLGPTGLTLRDWSPYKNHGTLTGMDAGTDWVASQGRYALDFDGVNDKVQLGTPVSLPFGSAPRTFSGWSFQTSYNNYITPFSYGVISSANSFAIIIAGSGGYAPGMINGNLVLEINTATAFSNLVVPLNSWSHLGIVYPGGAISNTQIYINGVLATTSTNVGGASVVLNTVQTNAMMGAYLNLFANKPCLLDSQAMYSRALSANEIHLLASRRGIAYELAPRSWSAEQIAAYRARYYSQLVGGGVI
jgi:hypothetical protein